MLALTFPKVTLEHIFDLLDRHLRLVARALEPTKGCKRQSLSNIA